MQFLERPVHTLNASQNRLGLWRNGVYDAVNPQGKISKSQPSRAKQLLNYSLEVGTCTVLPHARERQHVAGKCMALMTMNCFALMQPMGQLLQPIATIIAEISSVSKTVMSAISP